MTNHAFVLLSAVTLFSASAAYAQDSRGTAEQRAACAGDAFRLCVSDIPDAKRVGSCLRQKHAGLSPACRAVFDRNTISSAEAR